MTTGLQGRLALYLKSLNTKPLRGNAAYKAQIRAFTTQAYSFFNSYSRPLHLRNSPI